MFETPVLSPGAHPHRFSKAGVEKPEKPLPLSKKGAVSKPSEKIGVVLVVGRAGWGMGVESSLKYNPEDAVPESWHLTTLVS